MKTLLIAYGYDSRDVSESLSAYNLSKTIEKRHDITVLTKDSSDDPKVIQLKCRPLLGKTRYYRLLKLDYLEFIIKAYIFAKRHVSEYDVIHHISPISLRYPNPLSRLPKPFIWGPLGGTIPYPRGFAIFERRQPLIQKLNKLDNVRMYLDPFMVETLRNANRILVTSTAARATVPERYQEKIEVIPQGIDVGDVPVRSCTVENYIFSSGRLVPYKATELLVRAFARVDEKHGTKLVITGDGQERRRLDTLITDLGIGGRVEMMGAVSRERNLELLRSCCFCVFPALNEAFGNINLEAMAARKALIVTDWGGPADIVEEGVTGFKIRPIGIENYVQDLANKMSLLLERRDLRVEMGESSYKRLVENYSWDVIGTKINEVYRRVSESVGA